MPSLYTAVEINAPRRKVWRVLYHKELWMYWNTFLYDGDPEQNFVEGRKVLLSLQRVPGEEITEFQPQVVRVQPYACLHWVSTIPGFVSEHNFELQDVGRDRTQYIHQERFSGRLTRLFLPFIRQDEQQGIRRMARELKWYVEERT
ncbi:MAG: SRPBCC domain-containing protein [Leptolyngbyaceae cyanobacterium bins.302]|nr:SRPBCC domain-containing protein [Leptolyngbyaceae cyanobacterium bins.302]